MEKFSIVNLNEFTWHLNVALMGGVFAVFSLIYKDQYIYYGLITFAFGVSGHIFCKIFDMSYIDSFLYAVSSGAIGDNYFPSFCGL